VSKAIFYNTPLHGHINPSLPLAAELVSRGEQVIYYSTSEFRTKIEATGAEYRAYEHWPYQGEDLGS
jgi:UDP:flavonoid glycosyltransferase YjiC (YdhE family)